MSFRYLIIFLLLFPCLSYSQYIIPDEVIVDYSARNTPLREVLFDLSEEARVTIAFQEEIIPGDSLVNFSVNKQRIGKVIDYLLNRHHVKYKLVGNQIVLFKDEFYKSQDMITLSGVLKDLETGETLINANVYTYDKSKGTTTNEYGFYSFTLPKGQHRIYYSYLGYNTAIKEVSLLRDTTMHIEVDPNILLNEITITDVRLIPEERPEAATVEVLPVDRINSTLPIGGEPDIMRLAYTMPGVTSGADGFGGMSVRGGSTNQNLILLDGVPVYNANHLFGLFSVFNSSVIRSAKLYKGAFPAHYTGRLSSVLDIRTREGNNQKVSGDVTLGLLTGKVSLEGPIIKDKASFLLSYRRTTIDPWINELTNFVNSNPLVDRSNRISFYDLNTKVNFSLGDKSKIYLSYYSGDDNFDLDIITDNEDNSLRDFEELGWRSGNTLASIRWNRRTSNKTFLNATAYISQHKFLSFDHDRIELLNEGAFLSSVYDAGYYETGIKDRGFKLDLDYIPNSKHSLKLGLGLVFHDFAPQFIFANETDSLTLDTEPVTQEILKDKLESFNIYGTELEVFIEDNIRLGKYSNLNIGFNQLIVKAGKTYLIPQPRVLLNLGTEKFVTKFSIGRMGQFLHSLSNTGLGVPSDIWLPSTAVLRPETAWNFGIGQFVNFQKRSRLGLELFYKRMSNVTRYGTGILRISEFSDWEDSLPIGTGTAYGGEFSLRKHHGKTTFDLAYTYSHSYRTYDEIAGGERIRFRYDRRHVLNLSLVHKFNENVEFASNWEYGSGTPITIPDRRSYNYIDNDNNLTRIRIFSEVNNAELPAYHRLDLGFNFYNKYHWGSSRFTLGVYNVYGKINPLYVDEVVGADLVSRYEQFYLFRLLPSISYSLSF